MRTQEEQSGENILLCGLCGPHFGYTIHQDLLCKGLANVFGEPPPPPPPPGEGGCTPHKKRTGIGLTISLNTAEE